MSWQAIEFTWTAASPGATSEAWRLVLSGLDLAGQRGALTIDCRDGEIRAPKPSCSDGDFEWRPAGVAESLDGTMAGTIAGRLFESEQGGSQAFSLADSGLTGRFDWPDAERLPSVALRFEEFALSKLPAGVVETLGLSVLEGRVDGRIDFEDGRGAIDLSLQGGSFDRPDGLVAGAGLVMTLTGAVEGLVSDESAGFSLSLEQTGGELLAGPVYLPPPDKPLALDLSGNFRPGRLAIDALSLDDGGLVRAEGGLVMAADDAGWSLESIDIGDAEVVLPGAWKRWGEGIAATAGFGDLATEGTIEGAFGWRSGEVREVEVEFSGVGLRDARGRAEIQGLAGSFARTPSRVSADLGWDGLSIFSVRFGSSQLAASGRPEDWSLTQPLVLPLLDGSVAVDELHVRGGGEDGPSVELDARIEPLALEDLTGMLGLPQFGGRLSGQFPGVRLSGDRIAFTGGIDIRAFSGGIGLRELVIERPFGSLPALAAQVEFDRLDLAELTGAFNFGHMEGEMSGWMRDLRLLDWQPVAMDARVFTHDDASSRRISQRAVENLSRLGGGAAALGVTVLQIFEEFPYRRAGLACRLDRNICHIDGVAPHPSGGFFIVEGRGLPHLDVVGHRRLVDWPRLVAQLVAMTEG